MKFAIASTFFYSALAAPGLSSRKLPNLTPVHVEGLDSEFDIKCGQVTVAGSQISKAVQWGVDLQLAKQQVGANKYPHYYGNNGRDARFNFLDKLCNQHPQDNRREFPVSKEGVFEGDQNDDPKKLRAIYVFDSERPRAPDGHPIATYCGTIYHKGNYFEGCDIHKN